MASSVSRVMDLSSSQSNSKCSSDFSIERILSDGSKREVPPVPSWLCCTRYQPPRLPRTGSACRSRRSGRHARVPFTAAQAAALEAAYSRAPYLAPPALRALASALQLRDDRIKIWFQNRRARERREKSTNIPPPQSATLLTNGQTPSLSSSWLFTQHNEETHQGVDVTDNCTSNLYRSDCENSNESCESPLNVDT